MDRAKSYKVPEDMFRRKTKTTFYQKNWIPPVKYGGHGNVMPWGCFVALGSGQLAIIESSMNFSLY